MCNFCEITSLEPHTGTALKIIDEAIQIHGAHGLSQDSKLSDEYIHVRHVRLADGPDAVHLRTIAKEELKREVSEIAKQVSGVNKNIDKYGFFSKNKKKRDEAPRAVGMYGSSGRVFNSSL